MNERDDNPAGIEDVFCPFIGEIVPVAVGTTVVSTDGKKNSMVCYGTCYICECPEEGRRNITAEKKWRIHLEVLRCR